MTSSVQSTPRDAKKLNRTPRRLYRNSNEIPQTPECFSTVQIETPTVQKKGANKSSSDQLHNLKVAVRIRPMCTNELNCTSVYNAVSIKQTDIIVKAISSGNFAMSTNHMFRYDHIFDHECNQIDIFTSLGKPILNSAFHGYNACLFAYGQTGSGKSYSMMGENIEMVQNKLNDVSGIIPRFCYELFERITELPESSIASIEVSYFEVYNEKIHDLLSISASSNERLALKVREHPVWGPYVVNLSQHPVKTFTELQNWLRIGNKHRATAATVMNEKSSRSHSIFTIELSMSELNGSEVDLGRRSKISLVDLAGSERLNSSNVNDEHHRQSVSINRSLLTLGKVIAALAEQKKNIFVPYRESVLTWLLRESLGGNSLTSMLATISPASTNVEETLATLRYACQARSIVNRARINEDPNDRLIRELRAEVERLRALRQDYEQKSNISLQNTSTPEDDDLQIKLLQSEKNLLDAEQAWQKRFTELKRKQAEQLAKAEEEKAKLELHLQALSNIDQNVCVSPYKSNFLDQLEELLSHDDINVTLTDPKAIIKETQEWCKIVNLPNLKFEFDTVSNKIKIKNVTNNMFTHCDLEHLKNRFSYNKCPEKFLNSLKWQESNLTNVLTSNSMHTANKYLKKIKKAKEHLKVHLEGDKVTENAYNQFSTALTNLEKAMNETKNLNAKSVIFHS